MSVRNWGLLLILGMMWGTTYYFIEVLLVHFVPIQIIFLRVSIAALTLCLFCAVSRRKLPTELAPWSKLFVMGAFNNAIPFMLIAYGQGQFGVTAGTAAILVGSVAFFGVILAALFIKGEQLRANRIIGAFVGFVGVIITIGYQSVFCCSAGGYGQFMILLSAVSYAIAGIWGRLKLSDLDVIASATGMLICSSLQMLVICLFTNSFSGMVFTPVTLLYVLAFSVMGTSVAYMLYFKLLKRVGASNLLLVFVLVPVFASSLDALVLGQLLKLKEIIGFVVILSGLALLDGRLVSRWFTSKAITIPMTE